MSLLFLNRIGCLNQSERFSTSQVVGGVLCCQMIAFCIPFVFNVISSYFVVGFVKNTKNSEYFCHLLSQVILYAGVIWW